MSGREQQTVGSEPLGAGSEEHLASGMRPSAGGQLLTAHCSLPTRSRGFTLLELMIVISIIVILAVIIMPQYQRAVVHARETVLRDDLFQLRKLIDQYAADKGKLPQSLDELVTAGYVREIPKDPMTNAADWVPVPGEDPASADGAQGIVDVHSASTEKSTEDTAYNEW